jgi:hypothetical protein
MENQHMIKEIHGSVRHPTIPLKIWVTSLKSLPDARIILAFPARPNVYM